MKKIVLIVLVFLFVVVGLSAARTRAYTQKVTALGSILPNQQFPDVTATSSQTQAGYVVNAWISTRPAEVISTTTSLPAQIRLYRFGNGTTVPYDTRIFVQFSVFSTDWTGGETLHVQVINNNVSPAKTDAYDLDIPNNLTAALTITEPQVFDLWTTEPNAPPTIELPNSMSFLQNESTTIDFSTYVSDPDGDNLSLSVSGNNQIGVQIQGLSVTLSASVNWTGSETLTFTVNDGVVDRNSRATASDVVAVIVTNPLIVDIQTDSQLNNNVVAGDPQTAISFTATANLPLSTIAWDFTNDGITDSTLPTPSYTYPDTGMVSVKLVASDGVHVTTVLKRDYIHVHPGVVIPPEVLNQNIVWTEEGGPYNLTGEILLNPGYSLTIEPNAQVNMLVDNHLVINGSINATEANFTAYGENGWGGIVLGSTATNSVIDGINVFGAATGITINDCNPVLTDITLVAAESQRTPTQAIVINGASAPVISNLTINNFAYGIKANNTGITPVNLNINTLRVNRGTITPASGDTAFEINGNYIVDITSTVISEYPFGIIIDSSNRSRARARLANTRVIKTESNNRDNSVAFSLANLSQVEIERDSLSGFNTGIFISNQSSPCNITVQNTTIRRTLNQSGSEVGIKLLGSSSGSIDSTYVFNYNRALDLNGNHGLEIGNNKFEDCAVILSEAQNQAPHSLVRNLAYRTNLFNGLSSLPALSLDASAALAATNNTIFGYPSYVSAGNASAIDFSQNIAWDASPAPTPINLTGGSTINASYSDIAMPQGTYPGTANLNANPMFLNPALGNFALNVYSPCIDAGNPATPPDPDGSIADIGALTFNWATAPLIADFYADISSGQHPLTVQFTDHSTRNTISREWDFNGDNITDSTELNPVWTYTTSGNYSVKLSVFDGQRYDTKLVPELIQVLNTPPQISQVIPPQTVLEDSPAHTLELGNYFNDPNGDPLSYSFTQSTPTVTVSLYGSLLTINTIPDLFGTCDITVNAVEASRILNSASTRQAKLNTDTKDAMRISQTFLVTVAPVNDAPTISLLPSYQFAEDEALELDISDCIHDVDSPNLSLSVSGNQFTHCTIQGTILQLSADPNWFGSEQITVTVSDNRSRLSSSTNTMLVVTPVNDPPEIISFSPIANSIDTPANSSISFAVEAMDIDSQLGYHWYVNGEELAGNSASCTYLFSLSGTHSISVKVADEVEELVHTWTVLVPVSADNPELAPLSTQLFPLFPNPFKGHTTISYSIKQPGNTSLKVYNTKGQLIKTLCNSQHAAARYKLGWDGTDNIGVSVASGVYYIRMISSGEAYITKALLIK